MGMDMNKLAKENTMELNPAHPIVVNLNYLPTSDLPTKDILNLLGMDGAL